MQEVDREPVYECGAVPLTSPRPYVSICIVNWNCRDHLRCLLASIQQERVDFLVETIVVDNASTDDSAAMAEAEFPDVQLIRCPAHLGVASANNMAAARARGRLLLFLNNDTMLRPGSLAAMVKFLDLHPDVALIGPRLLLPDGRTQGGVRDTLNLRVLLHRLWFLRWTRVFRSAHREFQKVDFDLTRSSYVKHIVGAALLMRRSDLLRIGGWDDAFQFRMDDVDLSHRLAGLGRTYYLAEAQILHWGGAATELDRAYAYLHGERSTVHYIRKHFGDPAARVYKILVLIDTPVRIAVLGCCWLVTWLSGDCERAARNHRKLSAAWKFLTRGLPGYLAS